MNGQSNNEHKFSWICVRKWVSEIKLDWASVFHVCRESVLHIQNDSGMSMKMCHNANLKSLISKYERLFANRTGKTKGIPARLHLKEIAEPIFCKPHRGEFPVQHAMVKELDQLVAVDIFRKIAVR